MNSQRIIVLRIPEIKPLQAIPKPKLVIKPKQKPPKKRVEKPKPQPKPEVKPEPPPKDPPEREPEEEREIDIPNALPEIKEEKPSYRVGGVALH